MMTEERLRALEVLAKEAWRTPQLAEACQEIRELRRQRDDLHAHNNKALFAKRLAKEAGKYCLAKWGDDYKARGRKLLEESAEVMVSIADEWTLKQHGKGKLSDEIGDVLIVLWSICELTGIDADEAAAVKFRKVQAKHGLAKLPGIAAVEESAEVFEGVASG